LKALLEFDQIDEFNPRSDVSSLTYGITGLQSLDVINWLWVNAACAFEEADLIGVRVVIIKSLVIRSILFPTDHLKESVFQFLVPVMDDEMKKQYLAREFQLLPLLGATFSSCESEQLGQAFLGLVAKLDLDAKVCLDIELQNANDVLSYDGSFRRIVFEEFNGAVKSLRWEWTYDQSAPGYEVVTEFNGLSGDTPASCVHSTWPLPDFEDFEACYLYYKDRVPNRATRFARRMATKARKERARTGQKRPRSKMPGAWTW
jgi:hypothetical protein